jgi:hypothetical protein
MHLQQTKDESSATGGPQYYFHELTDTVKNYLRQRGSCPVVLQTPYGIAESNFVAVGKDHKLAKGKVVKGKVGHDRIQGGGAESIGEAIRYWYGLQEGQDFRRIDLDVSIHRDGHFIIVPLSVNMRGKSNALTLPKIHAPLSFHRDYQSRLWRDQIEAKRKSNSAEVARASAQINKVVSDHRSPEAFHILESDLLRAAGALSFFGLDLSAYLGKGYDCVESKFKFGKFPIYLCPVELKKRSKGFTYQVTKYSKLPRAVVLCMEHNYVNPPDHIDIVELSTLAAYLSQ